MKLDKDYFKSISNRNKKYIVVSDKTAKVVLSTLDDNEAKRKASDIRTCGGQCTVFKSTKL